MLKKWLRQFASPKSASSNGQRRAGPTRRAGAKPALETLEDRQTPSAFAAGAGGLLQDSGQGVGTDAAGNVYVAGNLGGTQSAIDTDAYVAKYATDGNQGQGVLLWSHQFGGPYGDSANAIAVDPAGNSYVTGDFRDRVDFGNGIVLTSTGAIDGFVAKFDTNGAVQWVHQFATDGNFGPYLYDRLGTRAPKGIALDYANAAAPVVTGVVVTGYFHGHIDLDPVAHPGQHFLNTSGAPDDNGSAYVVKLNAAGNFLWEAQADGPSGTTAFAVAVDRQHNVYTTGEFGSRTWFNDRTVNNQNPPNANSIQITDTSNRDVLYVWKLTGDGHNAFARQLETSANNTGAFSLGVAVDAAGSIYATGVLRGTGFDFGPGGTIDSAGGYDVFIEKLNAAGDSQWVRRAGGTGDDWGTGVALDTSGNPYVTGYISGNALFGNQLLAGNPSGNSFITELTPNGDFLCSHASNLLASNGDKAAAIVVDRKGFVDLTGAFASQMQWPGLPALSGAGQDDIFTIKTKLECSPIHITLIDGGILQILGDNRANRIEITDDRDWGILVSLDDDAPRAFSASGFHEIRVVTFGGSDEVSYTGGTFHPAVTIDTGAGDDIVTIKSTPGPDDNPQTTSGWRVDVNTGDGNDQVFITGTSGIPGILTVDLGRGNDTFNGDYAPLDNSLPPLLGWRINAGDGNDQVFLSAIGGVGGTTTVDLGDGRDTAVIHRNYPDHNNASAGETLNVLSGKGDKTISVTYEFDLGLRLPPGTHFDPNDVNIVGGTGANNIKVNYNFNPGSPVPDTQPAVFNVPLRTSIRGGDRGDDISVLYALSGDNTHDVIVDAPLIIFIDSAGGADRIFVGVACAPGGCDVPGGCPRFILNGPGNFDLRGGAGNDIVTVLLGDASCTPQLNGTFRLRADGQDGNDTLIVDLAFAPDSLGVGDVQVLGGRGNDNIISRVGRFPASFYVLLDGGLGIDTAFYTGTTTRAINFEH